MSNCSASIKRIHPWVKKIWVSKKLELNRPTRKLRVRQLHDVRVAFPRVSLSSVPMIPDSKFYGAISVLESGRYSALSLKCINSIS